MNGHDDEVWLDTMLQRTLPRGLSDEGFQERLLLRLPPRERPVRRAVLLGITWVAALILMAVFADSAGPIVPCSVGATVLWYAVDRWW